MMAGVGHIEVAHVDYYLPDGRMLLSDASFRVGQGAVVALVGPNGSDKSTLARLITGELQPEAGTVTTSGGVGVMPQFVGSVRDDRTVRDLLVSVARDGIKAAARAVDDAELAIMERDDEKAQMAYAQALSDWGDAGGYQAETLWDMCTMAALGLPYEKAQFRDVKTLSGGEQKRLVLAALRGGAGGTRGGTAARRARQLPGRAGQGLARGPAQGDAQDRAFRVARPGTA